MLPPLPRLVPWLVMAVLGAAAACGDLTTEARSAGGDVTVIATTSILGDVVRQVAGDDAAVEVLIPNGTDLHGFEASARQVARLQAADLIVANGLGLETSLESLLRDAGDAGVEVLEVAEHVDPLPFDEHADEDDPGHDELDPHFWTDPLRVRAAAGVIADALAALEPDGDWHDRASEYQTVLAGLHAEIEATLDTVPPDRRKLITNHEVFGYFAARYGFQVVGVVIPGGTTIAEPSAADLAALAATIRAEGVPAVFGETGQRNTLVDAVRREARLDVDVVGLYTEALGEPDSGAGSYVDMMRTNARRIAAALQ